MKYSAPPEEAILWATEFLQDRWRDHEQQFSKDRNQPVVIDQIEVRTSETGLMFACTLNRAMVGVPTGPIKMLDSWDLLSGLVVRGMRENQSFVVKRRIL